MRGSFKQSILLYVKKIYPHLRNLYETIFVKGDKEYWIELSIQIEDYYKEYNIKHINFFYHEELVKVKLEREKKIISTMVSIIRTVYYGSIKVKKRG